MPSVPLLALASSSLLALATAAFPPTPEGITTIQSKVDKDVSISYKETTICETTDGVKGYSGYVHLPPNPAEGRDYNVNTYFWFFEARNDPKNAPLSLWLQGGPGVPSVTAAVGENGPCNANNDSMTTSLNPWSWNTDVNMLYVDQPVQVGFSYDTLINGTVNELELPFGVTPMNSSDSPALNYTFLEGTFASQNNATTANTTQAAALAMWHFMQTWVQEFPEYQPPGNKVSIFTESYGGHYGPIFANYFEAQNDLIAAGKLQSATPVNIETLGLINACIDILTQQPLYPQMAFNNTYGLQIINETEYKEAMESFPKCENLTLQCREAVAAKDPQGLGNNDEVNAACLEANDFCFDSMWNPYNHYMRDQFDIARALPDPFPPKFAAGYLNTREVQQALGVPLNFTGESVAVHDQFATTGDFVRGGGLEAIGSLLDRNVKVALIYGDRDYQCNWLGGEQISLAINSAFTSGFHKAGYTSIQNSNGDVGGMVRQYGNLSFSRVFEAGHAVSYYQPETAFNIFTRTMFGKDVATGKTAVNSVANYSTTGPSDTFHIKSDLPPPQEPLCYLWDVVETCTPAQKKMLADNTAIVENFILVGNKNGTASTNGTGSGTGPAPRSNSSTPVSSSAGLNVVPKNTFGFTTLALGVILVASGM